MIYFKLYWENVHSPSRHRFGSTGFHLHVSDLKKRWKGFDWMESLSPDWKRKEVEFDAIFLWGNRRWRNRGVTHCLLESYCCSRGTRARIQHEKKVWEWVSKGFLLSLSLSLSIQQLILGLSYTSVYTSPTTEAGSCHFIHLGPDKETQSVTHWDKIGAGASITVKYWVKLYEITMFFYFVIQCDFLLNTYCFHLNINIQLWHR